MSQTQSIIVYRNPAEAALWESGMVFPLIGGLAVGTLVFLALCKLFERHLNRSRWSNGIMIGFAIISMGCGMLVFNHLFI